MFDFRKLFWIQKTGAFTRYICLPTEHCQARKSLINQEKMFFLTNAIEHAKIGIAEKSAKEVNLKRPFENASRKPLCHKP